jgi:dipeptidyl aminopeptidase/acylaminoacyl peptidase
MLRKLSVWVAALILFALAITNSIRAQSLEPLSVDALTGLSSLSRLWPLGSVSPDGHWLVYTYRAGNSAANKNGGGQYSPTGLTPDYASGTDIWVVDTHTGTTIKVTDGKGAVEEPVWSPDSKQVAFYADRDGAARVWIWSRETKQLRRASDAIVRPSLFNGAHLRWTPDGKYLITLVLPDGMTTAQAAERGMVAAKAAANDPTIPSGSTVIVRRFAPVAGGQTAMAKSTKDTPPETRHIWAEMESDLALIDVSNGSVHRVATGKPVFWYAPSPDGKWIAFAHQSGRIPSSIQTLYDIEVAPVSGGTSRLLAKFTDADYGFCVWSPDSTRLGYIGEGVFSTGDVHVIDVASGDNRNVSSNTHPDFGTQEAKRMFWSPNGDALLFIALRRLWRVPAAGGDVKALTPDGWNHDAAQIVADAQENSALAADGGRAIFITTINQSNKDAGFYRVNVSSGEATLLREEHKAYGGHHGPAITSADGSVVVWSAEDAQHPPDLWAVAPDFAQPRQLSHLNPQIEKLNLGKSRVVDYLGADGTPLKGALLLPTNYREGMRVPLVVRPYPGPFKHSDDVNRFGLEGATEISNMQMLATRGYAVLYPEVPQRLGTPMKDLVDGVNVAVDKVIELGIADPNRLAVVGQSYGGYSTISIVVQTQRFRAAAMSAGLADLISDYGHMDETGGDATFWAETGQGLIGGPPWQYRDRYVENSPIFYLDRVTTPLLILHGNKDTAVPVQQAEEIFVGLRRLNKEVEYREYIGEEHVPEGRENLVDFWNAIIRWFDTHLKPAQN